jgi:hypothetical protein
MDIYKTLEPILLEKTRFILSFHDNIEFREDIESEEPFAVLISKGKQIVMTIYDVPDWSSLYELMDLGRHLIQKFSKDYKNVYIIESILIECECDMDNEFTYEYRMNRKPWYFRFGYLPYFKNWTSKRIKDFFQIPFLKPDEYLDLKSSRDFISPKKLILEHRKHPLHLIAQKNPNDICLRLLPSTSFYYRSKRPITSMNLLRRNRFRVLDLSKIHRSILLSGAPFKIGNDFYIPVVRYSHGMGFGCYFNSEDSKKDKKNNYLGTFYYWEPDSDCYLRMGKRFEYFETKIECAHKMIYELECYNDMNGGDGIKNVKLSGLTEESSTRIQIKINIEKLILNLEKYIQNILYETCTVLKKGYEEYLFFERNVKSNKCLDEIEMDDLLMDDLKSLYLGKSPKYLPINHEYKSLIDRRYMKEIFYAAEDELDQFLAQALILIGYDVVVFGRMCGMFRVVSEVFDVRTREASFDQLCWRIN